ncbi:MAG: hypothetical protein E7L22_24275, partial [Citrobacter freundii]|nr:hypothetical protein [Citrobacter freundii]
MRDALRLSAPAQYVQPGGFYPAHTQKSPSVRMGFFTLFDAWQFMAGVLPATLRAVAAQRSNPL